MSQIVVVSGNPRPASRTSSLAVAVGTALAAASPTAVGSSPAVGSPAAVGSSTAVGSSPASPSSAADSSPAVVEVGALGPGLLTPGDPATAAALDLIRAAELLVIATPTYKGSYTGVLKVLLDQLPSAALAGKRAVPVVTAGVAPQAAAAEALLRQLLTELGADVLPGLPVTEADLPDTDALATAYAQDFHSHVTAR